MCERIALDGDGGCLLPKFFLDMHDRTKTSFWVFCSNVLDTFLNHSPQPISLKLTLESRLSDLAPHLGICCGVNGMLDGPKETVHWGKSNRLIPISRLSHISAEDLNLALTSLNSEFF